MRSLYLIKDVLQLLGGNADVSDGGIEDAHLNGSDRERSRCVFDRAVFVNGRKDFAGNPLAEVPCEERAMFADDIIEAVQVDEIGELRAAGGRNSVLGDEVFVETLNESAGSHVEDAADIVKAEMGLVELVADDADDAELRVEELLNAVCAGRSHDGRARRRCKCVPVAH